MNRLSVGVQTDDSTVFPDNKTDVVLSVYERAQEWINHQENKGLKLALIVLFGCIVAMFWYLRAQVREFQLMSQPNSRTSERSSSSLYSPDMAMIEELPDGIVRIGKITFKPDELLGKGCDGTFVYKYVKKTIISLLQLSCLF